MALGFEHYDRRYSVHSDWATGREPNDPGLEPETNNGQIQKSNKVGKKKNLGQRETGVYKLKAFKLERRLHLL